MFEVYARTTERMPLSQIADHARRAEGLGYDGLHVPDAVHDGLLIANTALNATEKLKVGTSVLVAFPRSPMAVAIAAWDLAEFSGGRFELGLGTQIKQNIVDRYSTPWTAPVRRMREYIESLRAIFDVFQNGGKLHYVGENYQFTRMQPFFNPGPIEHPEIPIIMGAVGPLMTQLAGKAADGMVAHPTNTDPQFLEDVCLPTLQKGAAKVGRQLDDFKLTLGVLLATGKTEADVAAEREKQRNMLGFLYSTPAYWPSLELHGWGDKGPQLQRMTRESDWAGMAEVVDNDMLDKFVLSATYDDIAAKITEKYQGLAGCVKFPLPEDPADDALVGDIIAQLQGK